MSIHLCSTSQLLGFAYLFLHTTPYTIHLAQLASCCLVWLSRQIRALLRSTYMLLWLSGDKRDMPDASASRASTSSQSCWPDEASQCWQLVVCLLNASTCWWSYGQPEQPKLWPGKNSSRVLTYNRSILIVYRNLQFYEQTIFLLYSPPSILNISRLAHWHSLLQSETLTDNFYKNEIS